MRAGDLPEDLLLVSLSARILTRSAARSGLRPLVLDLYGDADTRAGARAVQVVAGGTAGFDLNALQGTAGPWLTPERGGALVYGSGFDGAPEALAALAQGRRCCGNDPDLIRAVRDPDRFFALLRALRIPYPEVRSTWPRDPEHWLVKSGCGEGGKRVRFCARENPAGPGEYYQRRVAGPGLSVLFLADGRRARLIGFNTLWTVAGSDRPFLYAGAINRVALGPRARENVRGYVRRLVRALGLIGLNSLDFVRDGAECRVLELNPRPSATMALYDADFPAGLLAAHLRACQGVLPTAAKPGPVRAERVVLAPLRLRIPEELEWPNWCADRPLPGTEIGEGQPLCTVAAAGGEVRWVTRLIDRRHQFIVRHLTAACSEVRLGGDSIER